MPAGGDDRARSGAGRDGRRADRTTSTRAAQKARYGARREILAEGLTAAGFRIDHSEAGLYLWATRPGLNCWAACELLAAECGILVGPGSMYGAGGAEHIRVAFTATDERVAAAGARLRALAG